MNLKDFVSETLVSILEGVVLAQSRAPEMNAFVNPGGLMRNATNVSDNSIWDNRTNNFAQIGQFDVAVTAEDSASGGAKIKVLSGILGGDIGGEKANRNGIVSRVKFSVPILLPSHDVGDPAARYRR